MRAIGPILASAAAGSLCEKLTPSRTQAAAREPVPDASWHARVRSLQTALPRAPAAAEASPARQGVHPPVIRVEGDDIQVAVNQQSRPGRILALDPGDNAGAVLARLEQGGLEADLGKEPGDMLGGHPFARPGVVAGVGRVDPDQVAGQAGDLLLRGDGGHRAIVPPTRALICWGLAGPAWTWFAVSLSGNLICYRDAAGVGTMTHVRAEPGWRNRQTR